MLYATDQPFCLWIPVALIWIEVALIAYQAKNKSKCEEIMSFSCSRLGKVHLLIFAYYLFLSLPTTWSQGGGGDLFYLSKV